MSPLGVLLLLALLLLGVLLLQLTLPVLLPRKPDSIGSQHSCLPSASLPCRLTAAQEHGTSHWL